MITDIKMDLLVLLSKTIDRWVNNDLCIMHAWIVMSICIIHKLSDYPTVKRMSITTGIFLTLSTLLHLPHTS